MIEVCRPQEGLPKASKALDNEYSQKTRPRNN